MHYTINPLGGLGALRLIEGRLCAPDEEFCDDACVKQFQTWARNNAANAACLTNDQKHHLIDVCERVRAGIASRAEINAALALANDACAGKHRQECQSAASQWAAANPVDAACLSAADLQRVREMCFAFKSGDIPAADATRELNRLVAAGCPVAPPQPEPAPPPPIAPPIAPPPEPAPEAVDPVIYAEPATYTVPAEVFQKEEPTAFRKWGPIVGVLLIVGGGIYLLR